MRLALLSLAALLAACPSPAPPPNLEPSAAAVAPSSAAASDDAPTLTASAATTSIPSATAAPSAKPTASAPVADLPLLAQASASPGKIRCATVECDLATELCCEAWGKDHRVGTCLAKAGFKGCPAKTTQVNQCDEPADCDKGKTCCYRPALPESLAETVCMDKCEDPDIEHCLPGGKCSKPGFKCKTSKKDDAWGYCGR